MNPSALFIRRPVATILITLAIALVGAASYFVLPVAPLPTIDLPTVFVQASLPGASPEVMATSVATPLERRFGQIADLNELTSSSSTGNTRIIMQFGLDRDINGAARDVEAAINAARVDLPTSLRSNPTYRKVNPADSPIIILNLTSDVMTLPQIYDKASTIIEQKFSQIDGVGEVDLAGSSDPAVRVELNPTALNHYGLSPEDIRAAINSADLTSPKGQFTAGDRKLQIYTNDQGFTAADYKPVVVAYRDGRAVRLSDVAEVNDDVEDVHQLGYANGKPSIVVRITKTPDANIIATVDRIKALLPQIRAQIAPINLEVSVDRTITIRASIAEVERTLLIAIILVVLVVLVFLRNGRATLIPGVAVTVSLLGTLSVMFLCGFSLDNLSLMALTVATGFVVDDAIVVLENITRHVEAGMPRFKAALVGAGEVGFTVVSMSISLIAVFLPILLMGGIVGRMFREFAVTLSAAILFSLFISLTATPMMAARLIDDRPDPKEPAQGRSLYRRALGRVSSAFERGFGFLHETYEDSLNWALDHRAIVGLSLIATVFLTVWLYVVVPKGFFPQEDTGQLQGGVQVDQASSFRLTREKFKQIVAIIQRDPAVETVTGFSGSGFSYVFCQLKPLAERHGLSSDQVIQRLRAPLSRVSGAETFLQTTQDIRTGGRRSNAQYQYTVESDSISELQTWADRLTTQLKTDPSLTEVNSDAQPHGLETMINVDYDAAARLGLTMQQVDNTLNDSFGQALVATIYNPLNQYHVVMEVAPQFAQTPQALNEVYVSTNNAAGSNLSSGSGVRAKGTGAATSILPQPVTAIDAQRSLAARTLTRTNPIALPPTPYLQQSSPLNAQSASSRASNAPAATTATVVGGIAVASGLSGAGSAASSTGGGRAQTGIAVSTTAETMVPLRAFANFAPDFTPESVNHQDQSVATTISFNLAPGKSLSEAQASINRAISAIHMPATVHGGFRGTAQQFQQSLANEPLLILAALVAVYIVLGVLYESYVHPLTVLSTIPSAGVGAVAALIIFHVQFDIIALIGVILLIGIVKKNAIMIIDFALTAEREQGLGSRDAIYQACMLRFRPILMTTCAAILGAVPLALGLGAGGELRRPLGIAIIGGLVVSQLLTLLTTPVVYLYLDGFRRPRTRRRASPRLMGLFGPGRPIPSAES